ncbi:MAG: PhzF family phenazine biosynthesis protein [Betaproteobacteria bacterium]|nr:PhzF family phenazine biosynthesis protein [Betaproteobacteria bacterium]
MRIQRRFSHLDVFTSVALRGNPLAVVHDAGGLGEEDMAALARWTNLSETSFLLPPVNPSADYLVRIFTPGGKLPFAGHPTLGSCHAWLAAGGKPKNPGFVVQECGIGLVRVRRDGDRLAFAAPPLRRSGPLEAALRARVLQGLRIGEAAVRDMQWIDNGPPWIGALLHDAQAVLDLRPDFLLLKGLAAGAAGAYPEGAQCAFEVRAFTPGGIEDPVTGSFNAGLALWLIGAGIAPAQYVASQGTVLQRSGRVHVERIGAETWIGGDVCAVASGTITL